jgi:hypothetical protein
VNQKRFELGKSGSKAGTQSKGRKREGNTAENPLVPCPPGQFLIGDCTRAERGDENISKNFWFPINNKCMRAPSKVL